MVNSSIPLTRQRAGGLAAFVCALCYVVGLVMILLLGVLVPLFYLIWFGFVKTKPEQYEGSDVGVY